MRLVLFRHGIAIDRSDPECPAEEDRFLTARGAERTEEAARGLRRMLLSPERILSSPWLRARQTAEIAAAALEFDSGQIELSDALLPDAPPSALLAEVEARAALEVLVTGHAPHLDAVLAELVGIGGIGGTSLKKAGAASIEFTSVSPGSGRLEWMIPPRALRRLGTD
jgi:phosphohistidine phosphatase